MRWFARLAIDRRGVSAIEYALLAALIGLGLVTAAQQTGAKLGDGFDTVGTQLDEASGNGKGKGTGKPGDPGKPGKPPGKPPGKGR